MSTSTMIPKLFCIYFPLSSSKIDDKYKVIDKIKLAFGILMTKASSMSNQMKDDMNGRYDQNNHNYDQQYYNDDSRGYYDYGRSRR